MGWSHSFFGDARPRPAADTTARRVPIRRKAYGGSSGRCNSVRRHDLRPAVAAVGQPGLKDGRPAPRFPPQVAEIDAVARVVLPSSRRKIARGAADDSIDRASMRDALWLGVASRPSDTGCPRIDIFGHLEPDRGKGERGNQSELLHRRGRRPPGRGASAGPRPRGTPHKGIPSQGHVV